MGERREDRVQSLQQLLHAAGLDERIFELFTPQQTARLEEHYGDRAFVTTEDKERFLLNLAKEFFDDRRAAGVINTILSDADPEISPGQPEQSTIENTLTVARAVRLFGFYPPDFGEIKKNQLYQTIKWLATLRAAVLATKPLPEDGEDDPRALEDGDGPGFNSW